MKQKDFAWIAMIAAIYTVVSLALAPFSFGNIQVRLAESLTLLPLLYRPSILGVTLGCFLTNLLGAMMGVNPTGLLDAGVGTLATFLAASLTYRLKDHQVHGFPLWSFLMPVVFNFVFIGAELSWLYMPNEFLTGFFIFGSEVAIGEIISLVIGWYLLKAIRRTKIFE